MPQPQYGCAEGLADRLDEWADRLGRDKSFPWIGTGLVADLKAAAAQARGTGIQPPKPAPTPAMEFDL